MESGMYEYLTPLDSFAGQRVVANFVVTRDAKPGCVWVGAEGDMEVPVPALLFTSVQASAADRDFPTTVRSVAATRFTEDQMRRLVVPDLKLLLDLDLVRTEAISNDSDG